MDAASVVPNRQPYARACVALVLLGVLYFCISGYRSEPHVLHFRDFKEPYGSARCLLLHCDPYDSVQVHGAWHDAGGVDVELITIVPYTALYPPFSLAALAPIAALPLPVAHDVWKASIALLFGAAAVLVAVLALQYGVSLPMFAVLAVLTASSTELLMLGQVSGVAIPLLVIGLYFVLRQRFMPAAIFCLFAASMYKPQETGFLVAYLLLTHAFGRRVFVGVAVASVVFAVASIVWIQSFPAGANWLAELGANVQGSFLPGEVNSFGSSSIHSMETIQLSGLFGVIDPAHTAVSRIGIPLVSLIMLVVVLVPLVRLRDTLPKHLLALAALACFSLLPVYHRQYDSRLLLLVFPALGYLLAQPKSARASGYVGLGLVTLAVIATSHQFINTIEYRFSSAIVHAGMLKTLLLYRPMPVVIIILYAYFAAMLYRQLRLERAAGLAARPASAGPAAAAGIVAALG